MKQYVLKTLGCKANLYDSQLLEAELQKQGWVPSDVLDSKVELCIVNSCTVTNEADRQSRKWAAKLAKENPHAKVVMTGCAAEVDPEALAQAPGVHYVVGNQNKNELVNWVSAISSHILKPPTSILGTVEKYKGILSKHPHDREWPAIESFQKSLEFQNGFSEKTRSFLKIQEGCDSFCTYCIIPYGRGPSRSLRPLDVLHQIRDLVDQGVREVVITGTNIGEYGAEWGTEPLLTELLEQILDQTSLERLRVSSLDPTEITPRMMELMEKDPRFCPHFHVSLQSPSSKILRLMKRKYAADEVQVCLEKIASIHAPLGGVFVGMDVITGFPGESEDEFELGFQRLASLPWTRLHVFPYSERKGTPATRLPHVVPPSVRVERARKLTQLSMQRLEQHYRSVLQQCTDQGLLLYKILLEKKDPEGWASGYTPNYLRVMFPPQKNASQNQEKEKVRNQILTAQPTEIMIDRKGNDVALLCGQKTVILA